MFQVLRKPIDVSALVANQKVQRYDVIMVNGTVPALAAGGLAIGTTQISSEGDFLSIGMTARYTSLVDVGAGVINDDGTCHLSMLVRDQDHGINLFEQSIPMDMVSSPGRVRTPGVVLPLGSVDVQPSHQLYEPFPMQYLFSANSNITVEVRNDANTANQFWVCFWGVKIRRAETVKGVRA